ncbi:MAG TPA: hypothetical protein VFL62_17805 [Bradyrhizobium sp.]|nr:hypothetical protein [Bradyrhizobium sp.]HET7888083.1 hypothetical protein [Bradyrhizobium sp.]
MKPSAAPASSPIAKTGAARNISAPVTNAAKAAMLARTLNRSIRRPDPTTTGSARDASSAAAPSGKFTANSHGQPPTDNIAAPIAGPAADDSATVSAFHPIAAPSDPIGTTKRKSATPSDMTAAPPMPWKKRDAISHGKDGDNAQAIDASVNSATPAANTRR